MATAARGGGRLLVGSDDGCRWRVVGGGDGREWQVVDGSDGGCWPAATSRPRSASSRPSRRWSEAAATVAVGRLGLPLKAVAQVVSGGDGGCWSAVTSKFKNVAQVVGGGDGGCWPAPTSKLKAVTQKRLSPRCRRLRSARPPATSKSSGVAVWHGYVLAAAGWSDCSCRRRPRWQGVRGPAAGAHPGRCG